MGREARGTVALGAVHERLMFRDEQWLFYMLAFDTGEVFVSRRQPALVDRSATPVGPEGDTAWLCCSGPVRRERWCAVDDRSAGSHGC